MTWINVVISWVTNPCGTEACSIGWHHPGDEGHRKDDLLLVQGIKFFKHFIDRLSGLCWR